MTRALQGGSSWIDENPAIAAVLPSLILPGRVPPGTAVTQVQVKSHLQVKYHSRLRGTKSIFTTSNPAPC